MFSNIKEKILDEIDTTVAELKEEALECKERSYTKSKLEELEDRMRVLELDLQRLVDPDNDKNMVYIDRIDDRCSRLYSQFLGLSDRMDSFDKKLESFASPQVGGTTASLNEKNNPAVWGPLLSFFYAQPSISIPPCFEYCPWPRPVLITPEQCKLVSIYRHYFPLGFGVYYLPNGDVAFGLQDDHLCKRCSCRDDEAFV